MNEAQTQNLSTYLRREHAKDMVAADKRQKQIAKQNQEDHRAVEGLGRPVASFDAAGYMDLKTRQKVDPGDKDFVKWAVKRHPEVAVNCGGGTKIQSSCSHISDEQWPFPKLGEKGQRYLRTKKVYD
jgi:hypothetical protein